jgi:hypothetical protein
MKRTLNMLCFLVPLLLLSSNRGAEAKLIEIWGAGLLGGGYGTGNGDNDFYRWVRGGATGFELGAKVVFISGFIDYLRWFGGEEGANLLTFNLGGDWDVPVSESFAVIVRLAGGYYLGTLPENSSTVLNGVKVSQVDTQGIGVRGGLGLRYTFASIFSLGITPEFGYHYFFGGADEPLQETENNSQGFDFTALAYLRVGLGF